MNMNLYILDRTPLNTLGRMAEPPRPDAAIARFIIGDRPLDSAAHIQGNPARHDNFVNEAAQ